MSGIDAELAAALAAVAATDRLLLASDYDGCVSPIVSRPEDAVPNPRSIAALEAAAELPRTLVTLISGRSRAVLQVLSGASDALTLVGSHGAEFASGFGGQLTPDRRELLESLIADFESIAAEFPGTTVERKPASTALHVRNAAPEDAERALRLAESGPAALPGVHVTHGKAVIELAVIETSKGTALDTLRGEFGAGAVVFLGDDVTDEKAFARLRPFGAGLGDVGIKVGGGDTAAQFRIGDPGDVADVLERLVELRSGRRPDPR